MNLRRRLHCAGLVSLLLCLCGLLGGCAEHRGNTPSVKHDVENGLKQAGFKDLDVDEDRDKGVVTLSGKVDTWKLKREAEEVARQNSGNSVVANELIVRNGNAEAAEAEAENKDKAIEDAFGDWLKTKKLDKQNIHSESNNGVLTLSGFVDSRTIKKRVEGGAAQIEGVSQVVDNLEIKAPRKSRGSSK